LPSNYPIVSLYKLPEINAQFRFRFLAVSCASNAVYYLSLFTRDPQSNNSWLPTAHTERHKTFLLDSSINWIPFGDPTQPFKDCLLISDNQTATTEWLDCATLETVRLEQESVVLTTTPDGHGLIVINNNDKNSPVPDFTSVPVDYTLKFDVFMKLFGAHLSLLLLNNRSMEASLWAVYRWMLQSDLAGKQQDASSMKLANLIFRILNKHSAV
jgi:hypothetical protein